MIYYFTCAGKCKGRVAIEKKMNDPDPVKCPLCRSKKFERYYGPETVPNVIYAGRPVWTYNDTKKYKTFRQDGGPLMKVDPSKHGDLASWHSDAEIAPEPKKKKKKR